MTDCYLDYLEMRVELGYDMENTVYQKPRDLRAAHDRMVEERDDKKTEEQIREAEKKFPGIRKGFRKLRKRYSYEEGDLFIRPAASAAEIIAEGRTLHHCVGENSYMMNHEDGRFYILFLRRKEARETPYITVEMSPEGKIWQWYGEGDKKTDEKNMEEWLKNYVKWLKSGRTGIKEEVRLLVEAG